MALLNDLLIEAVDRCQQLTDDASDASAAADDLTEQAESLGERVTAAASKSHQDYQEFGEALKQAATELDRAGQEMQARLDAADAKVEEAEGDADHLVEIVEKGAEELATHRDETLEALAQEGEELETKLGELQQRIGSLQETATQGAEQATEALEELLTTAHGVCQELPQAWDQVEQSMEDLETEIDVQTQAAAAAFEESLAQQLSSFQAVGEKLVEEHNQLVEAFVARYTEQAFAELETAVGPLKDAMSALESVCQEGQEALVSRFGEITEKLTTISGLLDRIRPALELAGQLR